MAHVLKFRGVIVRSILHSLNHCGTDCGSFFCEIGNGGKSCKVKINVYEEQPFFKSYRYEEGDTIEGEAEVMTRKIKSNERGVSIEFRLKVVEKYQQPSPM